jgi:hypothetical protein
MAPYDPYTDIFMSSASPLQESFVPRKLASLQHVDTSAEISIDKNIDDGWNDASSLNHTRCQSSFSSLPSPVPRIVPSHPKLHDAMNTGSKRRPICRQPSILNPRSDIEDGIPTVCPCCHLRRHSSPENSELRSPKCIHTPNDDCCSDFCPDISISNIVSLPTARRYMRHSKLYQELKSPHNLGNNETADVENTFFPRDVLSVGQSSQNNGKTSSCVPENCTTSMGDDDVNWWAADDFD